MYSYVDYHSTVIRFSKRACKFSQCDVCFVHVRIFFLSMFFNVSVCLVAGCRLQSRVDFYGRVLLFSAFKGYAWLQM